jgi:DNA repair exonuclease SbcCD ATPase subunit
MHKWKEHIAGIKTQLQTLKEQLKPLLVAEKKAALQAQLQSIEQTINKLSKTGVEIPAELRDLKFRLLSDLDQFKEAATAHKELEELLLHYVTLKKVYTRKEKINPVKQKEVRTTNTRVKLIDLLKAKVIVPNIKLYRNYKNQDFKAILTTEGQIKLTFNGQTEYFDSPSSAAVTVTGKSQNGWTWWMIENENKTLDDYRKKYLNNETRR